MMRWTRTKTLVAGIVLITAANAVALIGVAYNRSDPPDSVLRLSQRELQNSYSWRMGTENTGVALGLRWQVLSGNSKDAGPYYYGGDGSPAWLNESKLTSLGFDVPTGGQSVHRRQLKKEVLLVLEFDGAARQEALERLRKKLADEKNLLRANPGVKEFENRTKWATNNLEREESQNSRLYVIDAGRDHEELRARYPDRARFVVVRGKVQTRLIKHKDGDRLAGYINGLMVDGISVPQEFQYVIGLKQQGSSRETRQRSYEFDVAFGKKLEPWVVGGVSDKRLQQFDGEASAQSKQQK